VNTTDLQRYKRLLLEKLDELSATHADAPPLAARAGEPMGILPIKRTPTPKQTCTSGCTKATLISCGRLRTHYPGSLRTGLACARCATLPCPRRGWKLCRGHVCAATARNASSQPLENNVKAAGSCGGAGRRSAGPSCAGPSCASLARLTRTISARSELPREPGPSRRCEPQP